MSPAEEIDFNMTELTLGACGFIRTSEYGWQREVAPFGTVRIAAHPGLRLVVLTVPCCPKPQAVSLSLIESCFLRETLEQLP